MLGWECEFTEKEFYKGKEPKNRNSAKQLLAFGDLQRLKKELFKLSSGNNLLAYKWEGQFQV